MLLRAVGGAHARGLVLGPAGEADGHAPLPEDVDEQLLAEPAQAPLVGPALQALDELAEHRVLDDHGLLLVLLLVVLALLVLLLVVLGVHAGQLAQALHVVAELEVVRGGEVVGAVHDLGRVLRGHDHRGHAELQRLLLALAEELPELVRLAAVELEAPRAVRELDRRDRELVHGLLQVRGPVGGLALHAARARAIRELVVPGEGLEVPCVLERPDVRDLPDEAGGGDVPDAGDLGEDLLVQEVSGHGLELFRAGDPHLAGLEQLLDLLRLLLHAPDRGGGRGVRVHEHLHEDLHALLAREVGDRIPELLADQGLEVLDVRLADVPAEHVAHGHVQHLVVHGLVVQGLGERLPLLGDHDERHVTVRGHEPEERALVGLLHPPVRAVLVADLEDRHVSVLRGVESPGLVLAEEEEGHGPRLALGQLLARLVAVGPLHLDLGAVLRADLGHVLPSELEVRDAEDLGAERGRGQGHAVARAAHLHEHPVAGLERRDERELVLLLGIGLGHAEHVLADPEAEHLG